MELSWLLSSSATTIWFNCAQYSFFRPVEESSQDTRWHQGRLMIADSIPSVPRYAISTASWRASMVAASPSAEHAGKVSRGLVESTILFFK
jgi:hypothetical protein